MHACVGEFVLGFQGWAGIPHQFEIGGRFIYWWIYIFQHSVLVKTYLIGSKVRYF